MFALLRLRKMPLKAIAVIRSATTINNPCLGTHFIYGFQSKKVVAGFVNSVLNLHNEDKIVNVDHIDSTLPPAASPDKVPFHFKVDVRCRTGRGEYIIVKLQNDFHTEKVQVEHSRVVTNLDQAPELGNSDQKTPWKQLGGIYTIVISNKHLTHKTKLHFTSEPVMEPDLVNIYEYRHTQNLERRYGDVPNRLVLVMLNNLTPKRVGEMNAVERWAAIFYDESSRKGNGGKLPEKKVVDAYELKRADAADDTGIAEFIDRMDPVKMSREDFEHLQRYREATARIERNKTASYARHMKATMGWNVTKIAEVLNEPESVIEEALEGEADEDEA